MLKEAAFGASWCDKTRYLQSPSIIDPENRPALKANGLLTRDSRKVERKNLANLELGKFH